jgi:hypothetical protein
MLGSSQLCHYKTMREIHSRMESFEQEIAIIKECS